MWRKSNKKIFVRFLCLKVDEGKLGQIFHKKEKSKWINFTCVNTAKFSDLWIKKKKGIEKYIHN